MPPEKRILPNTRSRISSSGFHPKDLETLLVRRENPNLHELQDPQVFIHTDNLYHLGKANVVADAIAGRPTHWPY